MVDGQQLVYGAPMGIGGPARANISPEMFQKLAGGAALTPEEMAQLSGQPPAPGMPGVPDMLAAPASPQAAGAAVGAATAPGNASGALGAAPGSAKASGKKDKKDKSGSKKL